MANKGILDIPLFDKRFVAKSSDLPTNFTYRGALNLPMVCELEKHWKIKKYWKIKTRGVKHIRKKALEDLDFGRLIQ